MAAPAFGALGTRLGSTTSTPAVAVPAGVTADQIIVVCLWVVGSITVTGRPAGFAAVEGSPVAGGTNNLHIEWKRATGADSGTYAFTLSASNFVYGRAARYTSGLTSGTPWDTPTSEANSNPTSVTTSPAVSVDTAGPDRLLIHAALSGDGDIGTWTAASGFTLREGGASVTNMHTSDKAQAVAGASGTVQCTHTQSDPMGAWLGAMIGTTASATGAPIIVQPPRRP